MRSPFQLANKSKEGCRSLHFAWKWFSLPTNGLRVQLILVHCTSSLVGSKGRPRIVLLWDPRGAGQGVCGPRGGAFTNTADAENLNCKGGKNRAGWMADILGWHNDQVGWLGRVPREPVQLHNWNRHPNTSPAGRQNWTRDRVWSVPGKWKKVDFIPLEILYGGQLMGPEQLWLSVFSEWWVFYLAEKPPSLNARHI